MTNKYRAVPTIVDGIRFASKKEARRWGELMLLYQAGKIGPVELQPEYQLVVNGQLVGKYRADFRYPEDGQLVVEDAKGVRTPVYKLKRKLMLALHGIDIKEV